MATRDTPASRFAAYNQRTTYDKKSEHVNLRLPRDLFDELTAVGNVEGLAMSDTIRMVLWRGIRAGGPDDRELLTRFSALASEIQNTLNNNPGQETND